MEDEYSKLEHTSVFSFALSLSSASRITAISRNGHPGLTLRELLYVLFVFARGGSAKCK